MTIPKLSMTLPGWALVFASALFVCSSTAASAQESDQARFDAIAREAAQRYQAAVAAEKVAPPPVASPVQGEPVTRSLTLDQAVTLAIEKNLDIAVERLNPQAFDMAIAAAEAYYLPTVNSLFGQQNQVQLPTSQLIGGQRVSNDTMNFNGGVTQNVPWTGGAFNVTWNNRKLDSSSSFNTFNPQYSSTLTAVFNQPLLRNRSTDANRTELLLARIDRDIADVQLRATLINTVADVRNAYWDLVYTIQFVIVSGESLELAEKLVEDNQTRVEVGTMAEIDVVQAEAEAATRRQTVAQAEALWRTAELALKRLIVSSTEDPLWASRLDPTDRPNFDPQPINVEAAVRKALDQRTDLVESRKDLETSDTNLRFLRNQSLPGLDFLGSYGLQGIGGTSFIRSGGLGSPIIQTIPGGYSDALNRITGREFPSWTLQFNVNYPVGTSEADANYARARVERNQSLAQIRALELQVATEVTNAALQVESNVKRLEAATAARQLAERRLEAEQSKFEVGISTNFFVVQAQRDLSDAQNAELRVLADYQKSLVEFERVQEAGGSGGGGAGGGQ
jgi:outer membrane protein TolC